LDLAFELMQRVYKGVLKITTPPSSMTEMKCPTRRAAVGVVTIPVPVPQHVLARLEQVRILPQRVGVGHIKEIAGHLRSSSYVLDNERNPVAGDFSLKRAANCESCQAGQNPLRKLFCALGRMEISGSLLLPHELRGAASKR
jgi:hypothetical protein